MRKLLWISLLVGSLILSGCVTLDVTTEINEDGSGEHRVILAVDSSLYTPGAFDETLGDVGKAGATVKEYIDDRRRGVLITYPFDNLEELSKQLSDDETVGELFDISAKKSRGLFKNTYSIDVKVDTRKFQRCQWWISATLSSCLGRSPLTTALWLAGTRSCGTWMRPVVALMTFRPNRKCRTTSFRFAVYVEWGSYSLWSSALGVGCFTYCARVLQGKSPRRFSVASAGPRMTEHRSSA